jgi:hypothetical protein
MKLCQIMFEAGDIIVKTDQTYQGPFLIEDGKVDIYHMARDRNIVVPTFGVVKFLVIRLWSTGSSMSAKSRRGSRPAVS